jgi:hypothetical protein
MAVAIVSPPRKAKRKEADMPLIRAGSPSMDELRTAYSVPSDENPKALRSYFMDNRHLAIIDLLAEKSGKSKGEVLRDMMDEWVEYQLEKAAG